jgi:putative endonuclease
MKQFANNTYLYSICFMFNRKFTKEPTEKQKTGQIGEDQACKHLEGLGYQIIERNYLKKWGEIDIVAKKGKKIHFIEVKSISRNIPDNVIRETDSYRAEDNMHPFKLQRLGRAVQSYLLDRNVPDNIEWHLTSLQSL